MRIEWDKTKEARNIYKHGFDFSFAQHIFDDPSAVTIFDRFENGKYRWQTFALLDNRLLVVVHVYPDPDDHTWTRIIGLRRATGHERNQYERGSSDG